MKRVTMKDVADAVGVHVSTVSRVLNPATSQLISADAAARIRAACRDLNYSRNVAAYSLKTNRTRMIGVIVPDITDPASAPIIRGIEDSLALHNYVAIVSNTDGEPRREMRVAEMMRARGVDGLILANVRRKDEVAEQYAAEGVPFVTVNRRVDDENIPSVSHNEQDGIRRSVTHLASLGHRSIAGIAGPQSLSTGFGRFHAFERQRASIGCGGPVEFATMFTEAEGERCVEELLARSEDFTALVCANDRLAVGAIAALRRRGLTVPEHISVTGFNDMPLADRLYPPLTTVRVLHHRSGNEAAEMLIETLEQPAGGGPARHVVLPVEFIVRGSTARMNRAERPARRKTRRELA